MYFKFQPIFIALLFTAFISESAISAVILNPELIINGGFETSPTGFQNGAFVATANEIPGWQIFNIATVLSPANDFNAPIISGGYSANPGGLGQSPGPSFLFQDFESVMGVTYNVQFDYQGWQVTSPTNPTLSTRISDGSLVVFSISSDWNSSVQHETGSFIGTGNTLRFIIGQNASINDRSYVVDNISVTAAVPEPGSFLILSTAIIGCVAFRSRRIWLTKKAKVGLTE